MGFEPFDPKVRDEYCYGKYQNIITSMDFERILSSRIEDRSDEKFNGESSHRR